ncbi:MAG: endonuclease/exonuclease/phosphatase family protein [Bacteroidota bacterium]
MKSSLRLFLALAFTTTLFTLNAQEQSYKVGLIGFYNLENLFDTIDTPDVRDTEFTPAGSKNYDYRIYSEKLENMSRVISDMGTNLSPDGVAILGVCEVENRDVLEDLVVQASIADRNYQIVHHDSPDERGIDVGLLYNPKYFTVTGSQAHPLIIYEQDGTSRNFTRDVLVVGGEYDGDPMYILVNHWPSRSGGEARSAPYRNAAALLCKNLTDSLRNANPEAKIVIMGDLNDDPTSPSVDEMLAAEGKVNRVRRGGLYNPMWEFYRKGIGTTAWRDAWSLFDQIIISDNWLNERKSYRFYQAYIHNPNYLVQKTGHFIGYPNRTFTGDKYLGGFSDHFPVYMAIIKPID